MPHFVLEGASASKGYRELVKLSRFKFVVDIISYMLQLVKGKAEDGYVISIYTQAFKHVNVTSGTQS